MKKANIYLVILLFAGFSSCNKESTEIDFSGRDLISRIMTDGEVYKEFTYNKSFLLNEEKSKFFYTKHNYNKDGQLTESEFYSAIPINFRLMKEKTATILGSTGLIGGKLLELLLKDNYYKVIRVIVRRPVEFNNPVVRPVVVDFSDKDSIKSAIAGSDALFCAVGTTQKKVKGDSEAYYKVDYDIPVNAARLCEETGCPVFLLVSSVGADSKSKNFYLKLKGEVEDKLREMKIASVSVFRPSMLLGKRREFRFGEEVAKAISAPLSFLFPSKYKPVKAENVARAMIAASKRAAPGFNVYHYREMINIIETS